MNEINFEIKDIEEINLAMDVGIKKIYPPIENLEVTPTKERQIFTHEGSYGYDEVMVDPIPEEYIIPEGTLPITENITYDVREFARVTASVYPTPNLQNKEITPTKETQTVSADEEYDGLNNVTVNPIPDEYIVPSGTLNITENGEYDVSDLEKVLAEIVGGEIMEELTMDTDMTTKEKGLYTASSTIVLTAGATKGTTTVTVYNRDIILWNGTANLYIFTSSANSPVLKLHYVYTNGIGYVKDISLANLVDTSSVQTIVGTKTFSTLPQSSATPTTNNQLVNKQYVDDMITSGITSVLEAEY